MASPTPASDFGEERAVAWFQSAIAEGGALYQAFNDAVKQAVQAQLGENGIVSQAITSAVAPVAMDVLASEARFDTVDETAHTHECYV